MIVIQTLFINGEAAGAWRVEGTIDCTPGLPAWAARVEAEVAEWRELRAYTPWPPEASATPGTTREGT